MIEFRLRDYLAANAGVVAIVGSRIHPVRVPRFSMAADSNAKLTYRRKSGGRTHLLSGADGHPMPNFELICWSQSYDTAKLLADAVRTAMDGFTGTFTNVNVFSVLNVDEADDFFEPEDGSDDGWYAVILDYAIRYTESVPTFS